MNTITAKRYSSTGEFLGHITLPLRKSLAQERMMIEIQKSEGRTMNYRDLDALDAGAITLDKLGKLFSPSEIKRAVAARINALDAESEELKALHALLGDDWDAALGGERASKGRKR